MNNVGSFPLAILINLTIAIPFATACLALAVPRGKALSGLIATAGTLLGLAAAIALALRAFASPFTERLMPASWSLHLAGQNSAPAWQTSFVFRADALSATILVGTGLLFFVAAIYSRDRARSHDLRPQYYFFLLLAYAGTVATVLAGDLLTLFVAWEFTTITFAALMLHPLRAPNVSAAKSFVATSLATSIPMFFGIIWLLSRLGTVELTRIWASQPAIDSVPAELVAGATLLALLARAGVIPLHAWLTRAGEVVISPVSLIVTSALTVTGTYAIIRVFLPSFALSREWTIAIAAIGAVSAIIGPIGALRSINYKAALAYLAIGQMGLVLMPLGVRTAMGEAAALFQLIGFFTYFPLILIGLAQVHRLSLADRRWPRIVRSAPSTLIALVVGALGLAGMPPFSGFSPRLLALQALLEAKTGLATWLLVAVFLGAALSAAAAISLLLRALASELEPREVENATDFGARAAIAILSTLTFGLGLVPELMIRDLVRPIVATTLRISLAPDSLQSDTLRLGAAAIVLVMAIFAGSAIYLRQRGLLEDRSIPYARPIRILAWPAGFLGPIYRALAFLAQSNVLDAPNYAGLALDGLARVAAGVVFLAATRHAPDPDAPWDYKEEEPHFEEPEAA